MAKSPEQEVFKTLDDFSPYASYLNENALSRVTGYIDTGSYGLNAICSGSLYGGIPLNRLTVFAGESMTGKTLISMKLVANMQKAGLYPVVFDSENAFDPDSAERLGIDTSKVKYVPCSTLEETRNAIYNFLIKIKETSQEGKFAIIIDSLSNMFSEMEMKRMDKSNIAPDMGSRAKAMKSLLQMCINMSTVTRTTIVGTAWIYDDPSAMFPSIEKHIPGGRSVKFLPSLVVQLSRKPVVDKDGKEFDSYETAGQKKYSGVILKALTVKNRLIRQYLECETYLSFKKGFDRYYGLLTLAVGMGIIEQSGATYRLGDRKLGYYKTWRSDIDLWENEILPKLEKAIQKEWKYHSVEDEEDDVLDSETPEI